MQTSLQSLGLIVCALEATRSALVNWWIGIYVERCCKGSYQGRKWTTCMQRDARIVSQGHNLPLQLLGVSVGMWQGALQALQLSLASDACKAPASSEAPSELRLLVMDPGEAARSSVRVWGQLACARARAHPWCWWGGRIVPFSEWQAVYLDDLHG